MQAFEQQGGSVVRHSRRLGIRTITVLALAFAIALATIAAPARAGETPNSDLEGVRATVLEAVNWKINSLSGMKAETANSDKIAIYAGGIAELTSLRDSRIVSEDNIPELWALKEQVYGIYQATIAAANNVPSSPAEELAKARDKAASTINFKIKLLREWIAGVDNPSAANIIESGIAQLNALHGELEDVTNADAAWVIKDRAKAIYYETIDRAESAADEPTEEQKAAEALEKTRRTTLHMIERKTAILDAAADAAKIPAVIEIFASAAQDVENLTGAARSAKTISALKKIQGQVADIYESAQAAVADIRGDGTTDGGDDATDAIESHLTRALDYVTTITDRAEWSANESPETWEALLTAQANVVAAVAKVNEVIASGTDLDDRWDELNDAMRDFRQALIAHYVALRSDPMFIGGFHVAG
ncbi:MAG: hypothetical protein BMS9Abin17_0483 [Acidimicrobiia bacterium]|nr:MAG: hypothetical protein BMS9Abin17_0483 [Acidimicrobiia bacterium]